LASVDNLFTNMAHKGSVKTRLTNVTRLGRGNTWLTAMDVWDMSGTVK